MAREQTENLGCDYGWARRTTFWWVSLTFWARAKDSLNPGCCPWRLVPHETALPAKYRKLLSLFLHYGMGFKHHFQRRPVLDAAYVKTVPPSPDAIRVWGMSDSVFVALPLSPSRDSIERLMDIHYVLLVTSWMWLTSLASGVPLRGGIDIGTAAPILPIEEVYGDALAKAHHLESKFAGWPRIALGDTLVSTLRAALRKNDGFLEGLLEGRTVPTAPGLDMEISRATRLSTLMILDPHKQPFLDTIGPAAMAFLAHVDSGAADIFRTAYANAQKARGEFQADGEVELAKRYTSTAYLLGRSRRIVALYRPTCHDGSLTRDRQRVGGRYLVTE